VETSESNAGHRNSTSVKRSQLEAVAKGKRPFIDPDGWESMYWAREVAPEQRQAAWLFAEGVGPGRIDRILGLPPGQVREWWIEDESFQHAARSAYFQRRDREARDVDFALALKPRQREAARLYFVELKAQVEVAAAVGVTARTIRNWLTDPAFQRYGEQLRVDAAEARRVEREAREAAFHSRLDDQREMAQDVIEEALEEGDRRVALALVRPLLGRDTSTGGRIRKEQEA
jgi:hypothetical protein